MATSKEVIRGIITSPTLYRFIRAQYYDTYSFTMSMPKLAPTVLFSFENEADLTDLWDVSTNDCHPYTGQLNNCNLSFDVANQSAHFRGKIVPNLASEDGFFKYGYCTIKTRMAQLGSIRAYPTFNLDLFSRLEVVYKGDYENPMHNPEIPFTTKCIFNVHIKPSILSLPSIFQCIFEVLPGWNRLVVPFNNGALKYVRDSWYDMRRMLEPSKVCMFGIGFAGKDLETQFDFRLKSITAVPNCDSRGILIDDLVHEREAEPHHQVPLEDDAIAEKKIAKPVERKRIKEIY